MPPADAVHAVGPAAVSRFVLHRLARLGPASRTWRAPRRARRRRRPSGRRGRGRPSEDAPGGRPTPSSARTPGGDRAALLMHPIVAAAIYEDLAPGELADRHAAAAGRLAEAGAPAERIAAHLLLAAPAQDAGRVATLRAAAASAVRRGAPEAAAVCLRRSLNEPPPAAELGAILFELGRCELAAMELTAAEEHLRAAATAGGRRAARRRRVAARPLRDHRRRALGRAAAATVEAVIAELEPDDLRARWRSAATS